MTQFGGWRACFVTPSAIVVSELDFIYWYILALVVVIFAEVLLYLRHKCYVETCDVYGSVVVVYS